MNFPKPLLPSQDRARQYEEMPYRITREIYKDKFVSVFCWVLVLTGFALIGWAFAEYV